MYRSARLASAAIAVAIVVVGGAFLLRPSSAGPGASPGPSSSVAPSVSGPSASSGATSVARPSAQALSTGSLTAGTWTSKSFEIPLSFTTRDGSWEVLMNEPGSVFVQKTPVDSAPSVAHVDFIVVRQVPTNCGQATPAWVDWASRPTSLDPGLLPDSADTEFSTWFLSYVGAGLTGSSTGIEVDGHPAARIFVQGPQSPCAQPLPVAKFATDNSFEISHRYLELWAVDGVGPNQEPLLIVADGDPGEKQAGYDRSTTYTHELLNSIVIR